jgi:hypothetical protein
VAIIGHWRYQCPRVFSHAIKHHMVGASKLESGVFGSARRSDLAGKIAEMDAVEANFRAEAAANLVEIQTKAAQFLSRKDALQGKVRHAEIRAPLS